VLSDWAMWYSTACGDHTIKPSRAYSGIHGCCGRRPLTVLVSYCPVHSRDTNATVPQHEHRILKGIQVLCVEKRHGSAESALGGLCEEFAHALDPVYMHMPLNITHLQANEGYCTSPWHTLLTLLNSISIKNKSFLLRKHATFHFKVSQYRISPCLKTLVSLWCLSRQTSITESPHV
jgi:hypothetical protein